MARHPGVEDVLQFFHFEHLPEELQAVSKTIHDAAVAVVNAIPVDSPQLTLGLHKLLEAKDCFVRADAAAKGKIS
jgi:hypothetical protein